MTLAPRWCVLRLGCFALGSASWAGWPRTGRRARAIRDRSQREALQARWQKPAERGRATATLHHAKPAQRAESKHSGSCCSFRPGGGMSPCQSRASCVRRSPITRNRRPCYASPMNVRIPPEFERFPRERVAAGAVESAEKAVSVVLRDYLDRPGELRRLVDPALAELDRGDSVDGPEFMAKLFAEMNPQNGCRAYSGDSGQPFDHA